MTIAITWAIVATTGAVVDYLFMSRKLADAKAWSVQLECMRDDAWAKMDRTIDESCEYIGLLSTAKAEVEARCVESEAQLDAIRHQRSLTTTRGNLTRSANRKALAEAKRSEITARLEQGL